MPGVLDASALAALAAARECGPLSPLGPFRTLGTAAPAAPPLPGDLLASLYAPQRVCALIETTREGLRRDMLLVRDSTCCRWLQEGDGVRLERESSPRAFLERLRLRLAAHITGPAAWDVELTRAQFRTLKGIEALCEALSRIDPAAAFVSFAQIASLLGAGDRLLAHVAALAGKGLVGLAGGEDPLITLTPQGSEILLDLSGFDAYCILQARSSGVESFPSLHFSARQGHLSLITGTADDEAVIVRTLDAEALGSLVNWAWVAAAAGR